MKLEEFLKNNRCSLSLFASIINVSRATIHNIIINRNKDVSLNIALSIEIATRGEVRPLDLINEEKLELIEKNIEKKLRQNNITWIE